MISWCFFTGSSAVICVVQGLQCLSWQTTEGQKSRLLSEVLQPLLLVPGLKNNSNPVVCSHGLCPELKLCPVNVALKYCPVWGRCWTSCCIIHTIASLYLRYSAGTFPCFILLPLMSHDSSLEAPAEAILAVYKLSIHPEFLELF